MGLEPLYSVVIFRKAMLPPVFIEDVYRTAVGAVVSPRVVIVKDNKKPANYQE